MSFDKKKLEYINIMKYYSGIKNKLLMYAITCTKGSGLKKLLYCMYGFIYMTLSKRQKYNDGEQIRVSFI